MNQRTVVIRRNYCRWSAQKQKPKKDLMNMSAAAEGALRPLKAGFVNPVVSLCIFGICSGLFYLYSINQSAIKGVEIRDIEKQISEMRRQEEVLTIREAELKSLYHIESAAANLNMAAVDQVRYIDDAAAVAFGRSY